MMIWRRVDVRCQDLSGADRCRWRPELHLLIFQKVLHDDTSQRFCYCFEIRVGSTHRPTTTILLTSFDDDLPDVSPYFSSSPWPALVQRASAVAQALPPDRQRVELAGQPRACFFRRRLPGVSGRWGRVA